MKYFYYSIALLSMIFLSCSPELSIEEQQLIGLWRSKNSWSSEALIEFRTDKKLVIKEIFKPDKIHSWKLIDTILIIDNDSCIIRDVNNDSITFSQLAFLWEKPNFNKIFKVEESNLNVPRDSVRKIFVKNCWFDSNDKYNNIEFDKESCFSRYESKHKGCRSILSIFYSWNILSYNNYHFLEYTYMPDYTPMGSWEQIISLTENEIVTINAFNRIRYYYAKSSKKNEDIGSLIKGKWESNNLRAIRDTTDCGLHDFHELFDGVISIEFGENESFQFYINGVVDNDYEWELSKDKKTIFVKFCYKDEGKEECGVFESFYLNSITKDSLHLEFGSSQLMTKDGFIHLNRNQNFVKCKP